MFTNCHKLWKVCEIPCAQCWIHAKLTKPLCRCFAFLVCPRLELSQTSPIASSCRIKLRNRVLFVKMLDCVCDVGLWNLHPMMEFKLILNILNSGRHADVRSFLGTFQWSQFTRHTTMSFVSLYDKLAYYRPKHISFWPVASRRLVYRIWDIKLLVVLVLKAQYPQSNESFFGMSEYAIRAKSLSFAMTYPKKSSKSLCWTAPTLSANSVGMETLLLQEIIIRTQLRYFLVGSNVSCSFWTSTVELEL